MLSSKDYSSAGTPSQFQRTIDVVVRRYKNDTRPRLLSFDSILVDKDAIGYILIQEALMRSLHCTEQESESRIIRAGLHTFSEEINPIIGRLLPISSEVSFVLYHIERYYQQHLAQGHRIEVRFQKDVVITREDIVSYETAKAIVRMNSRRRKRDYAQEATELVLINGLRYVNDLMCRSTPRLFHRN